MGSSALGASLLKRELKSANVVAQVMNSAIDQDFEDGDLLVTHQHFEQHLRKHYPQKVIVGLKEFTSKEGFKKVIEIMEQSKQNTVLLKSNIRVHCPVVKSDDAILLCGQDLLKSGYVEEGYLAGMLERDHSLSVFMGNKIALPHGEYDYKKFIKKSGIVVHVYDEPIDWHGEKVNLVVGLAGIDEEHIQILSNIATVFGEMEAVDLVIAHQNIDEIYALLTAEDSL